ncbi:hypothetical protein GMOD_00003498 [Pyrenophora seminiperda CCB06]|uniref:Uncharacterized protein n=1 Tax=Pyrenophora seminiperda CCB06 TaxID=1302712 RepID=A0A3M7MJB6_9PLEO|nr:hypothetical protein GMOD_00003498 [Pyrenophora seminiperda CCB06]
MLCSAFSPPTAVRIAMHYLQRAQDGLDPPR